MRIILKTFALLTLTLSIGCGSSEDNGGSGGENPNKAVLLFPLNNSECTTGSEVSTTQSSVTFEWNAAQNATLYYVYVKNLNTQTQLQFNAESNTSMEINLLKGTPFSWYVVAKAANGTLAESEKWKFYNAGDAVENYIPFPVDLVAPIMSSSVQGPAVDLEWSGNDIDNDIVNYKVYFGTNPNPTTLIGTVTEERLNQVNTTSNTNYYWKVVTTDEAGNYSTSTIFQFKTF
ncbi:hypothetical protein J2X31_000859 [Flavobacterium arsenatis]|uniref:Fibronectin type-III domain-containing protein n=1 Tax=Flavobacterium arsenatis TaxID=1484332 RepID=A0ABU1TLL8_9FLAO|nr:hypothetical protein [Flavobacterium arsenatis]MDR6966859.1 hypothetical protein [Flavobacterium arsenatis]